MQLPIHMFMPCHAAKYSHVLWFSSPAVAFRFLVFFHFLEAF